MIQITARKTKIDRETSTARRSSKVSQRGRHMPTEGYPPAAVARLGVLPHERLALALATKEHHSEGVKSMMESAFSGF